MKIKKQEPAGDGVTCYEPADPQDMPLWLHFTSGPFIAYYDLPAAKRIAQLHGVNLEVEGDK